MRDLYSFGGGPGSCGGAHVGHCARRALAADDAAALSPVVAHVPAAALSSAASAALRVSTVMVYAFSSFMVAGCGEEVDREGPLRAAHVAVDSALARGEVEAAEAVMSRALALDSAAVGGEHGTAAADSVAAWMVFRLGVARMATGDRRGSLRAFGSLWLYGRAPLPDSLHAEAMRASIYVVSERADGEPEATRADTIRWIGVLDRAEVAARAAGENRLAAEISNCRSLLLWGVDKSARVVHAAACGPDCPAPRDPGSMGMLFAFLAWLAVVGAVVVGVHAGLRLRTRLGRAA